MVFDQVMTDSAKYADLVLPSTTFFEHYDVAKGYGAYHLQVVRPVIEPIGESRSNHEVFHELGCRLGLAGCDLDDLGDTGALLEASSRMPPRPARRFSMRDQARRRPWAACPVVDVFRIRRIRRCISSRRPRQHRGAYTYETDPATSAFPLALISPASERTISSTLAEFRPGVVSMRMHPDDAQPRGIAEGDEVRVFNDLGDVHCLVNITPEIRPGVVSIPKGLWTRARSRPYATALAPDSLADLAAARSSTTRACRLSYW